MVRVTTRDVLFFLIKKNIHVVFWRDVNSCFGEFKKKNIIDTLIFGCTSTVARTQTEVLPTCEPGIRGRVQEPGGLPPTRQRRPCARI